MPRIRVVAVASVVVIAAVLALIISYPGPAAAGASSEELTDLVAYARGSHSLNLRLQALAAIGKLDGAENAFDGIARNGDPRIAIYATTSLGKQKSEAARGKLRGLVTDSDLGVSVRMAAMTAISVHLGTASDLAWLEGATKDDGKLKGHYAWLKTNVNGK